MYLLENECPELKCLSKLKFQCERQLNTRKRCVTPFKLSLSVSRESRSGGVCLSSFLVMLSLRFYHYLQKNSSQKNGFLKKHLVIMKNFHILRFELQCDIKVKAEEVVGAEEEVALSCFGEEEEVAEIIE